MLRVPTEAVLEGDAVFVFSEETGELSKQKFDAGLSNWNHIEVTGGLSGGTRIVLSIGRAGVEAGAKVVPENADAEP